MVSSKRLVQCVPNFSEGRNKDIIQQIISPIKDSTHVKLLDYQSDPNHNRLVVTLIGPPEAVADPLIQAIGAAVRLIDMNTHHGDHPRMGAVDVVPFIPLMNMDMADAVRLSKEVAKRVAATFDLPIFLYEASAVAPHRIDLADIRKGEFEHMAGKMTKVDWRPDYGPDHPHPTAGVTAMGARPPLIAFNVNLRTEDMDIARTIAGKVRHRGGGFRYCKAIGVALKDKQMVQVSMNMTNFKNTSLSSVFEMIRAEAARYGVTIAGSEIVGLCPMEALKDVATYYLGLHEFPMEQIIESRLIE